MRAVVDYTPLMPPLAATVLMRRYRRQRPLQRSAADAYYTATLFFIRLSYDIMMMFAADDDINSCYDIRFAYMAMICLRVISSFRRHCLLPPDADATLRFAALSPLLIIIFHAAAAAAFASILFRRH